MGCGCVDFEERDQMIWNVIAPYFYGFCLGVGFAALCVFLWEIGEHIEWKHPHHPW
jgi:hypothetical protein